MAIIPQKQLFGWKEINFLGDLERLILAINNLPDERLMRRLEALRGKGRDEYPVRPVWNSIISGVIFQHDGIESLRRELLRNGQLRNLCGFDVTKGIEAVPPSWAYSRFLKNLLEQREEIDEMFDDLVDRLKQELADYGRVMMVDGKAIDSHARGKKKEEKKKEADGRRDIDADWGQKKYEGVGEDGTAWQKVKGWFGYKLHLVVDAKYELPIAYEVTKASASEMPVAHKLLDKIEERHEELLDRCEYWGGDRGYDDGKMVVRVYEDYGIKPVIDIRNLWKDGEETKVVEGQWNVVYNFKGQVFCVCPKTGEQREMGYGGFERDRMTLKYRCPAEHYGMECGGLDECPVGKAIRVPLEEDRRVFTPLARSSYKWENIYDMRTAVERVNSRLDVSFGFERHFIRGYKKMKVRCGIALCVMLAMALGRIRENQKGLMRSLVKSA